MYPEIGFMRQSYERLSDEARSLRAHLRAHHTDCGEGLQVEQDLYESFARHALRLANTAINFCTELDSEITDLKATQQDNEEPATT